MLGDRFCFEEAWPVSLLQELLGPGLWAPEVEQLVRQILSFGQYPEESVVFIAAFTCNALLSAEVESMRQQIRRKREHLLVLLHGRDNASREEALQELGDCAAVAYAALTTLLHERKAKSALEAYLARLHTLGYTLPPLPEKPPPAVVSTPPLALGF